MADRNAHTILVVDDDALQRMHASDLLSGAGYGVLEAVDTASALQVLKVRPDVRLLFTDIQMPPGADGIALAKTVQDCWPHVLLLVTSGGQTMRDEDLPDHGRFVAKPYSDRVVLSHVASLIADQRAGQRGGSR